MTGNVLEQTINIENRAFVGSHGDGRLNLNANADVLNWPGVVNGEITKDSNPEIIYKGGAWDGAAAPVSDRSNRGGGRTGLRGVRSLK